MEPPRLRDQHWTPVTFDQVCLAFLQAEWDKWHFASGLRWLIDEADLQNPTENRVRLGLLDACRGPLVRKVPPSTGWYAVRSLEEAHLTELLVIGRCGWDAPGCDANELTAVARRKKSVLATTPARWQAPILWGHTIEGPFTILEGNNRLVAYASSAARPPLGILTYVGLSADACVWHLPDSPP